MMTMGTETPGSRAPGAGDGWHKKYEDGARFLDALVRHVPDDVAQDPRSVGETRAMLVAEQEMRTRPGEPAEATPRRLVARPLVAALAAVLVVIAVLAVILIVQPWNKGPRVPPPISGSTANPQKTTFEVRNPGGPAFVVAANSRLVTKDDPATRKHVPLEVKVTLDVSAEGLSGSKAAGTVPLYRQESTVTLRIEGQPEGTATVVARVARDAGGKYTVDVTCRGELTDTTTRHLSKKIAAFEVD